MNVDSHLQRYLSHERGTRLFLEYILTVQRAFPHFAARVPADKVHELREVVEDAIYLSREIYRRPDLGNDPPAPLPFDADCPEEQISDQMRERIGRYAPMWDLINAPFTHPIGTQLAMICIDNAWNGYDTFIKALKKEILRQFADHPNVVAMKLAEQTWRQSNPNQPLPTDQALELLGIRPTWDQIREFMTAEKRFHVVPSRAEETFNLAKQLRNVRSHHFGEPSPWLTEFMNTHSFAEFQVRMIEGEMEVTTVCSRNVIEVIGAKALITALAAQRLYQ